ncbi:DUF3797 domain-containing protein [Clostridioides difficile]|nr:DUF3797 domain-containing protein [Clostridioides difficile]
MKMINVFKLLSMYCICPECESDEYTFHRKCKCGFDIIVDERNDEI